MNWSFESPKLKSSDRLIVCLALASALVSSLPVRAQVETVENTETASFLWRSVGSIEGHLALKYSPAGAFSPDSAMLAVASDEKIVLLNVRDASIQKVLKTHLAGVTDIDIQSAGFLAMNQLLVLGTAVTPAKDKGQARTTPLLAFQWATVEDRRSGKVEALGGGGGYKPILYFPQIRYLVLYKAGVFDLWNPRADGVKRLTIPDLTNSPNEFTISPDGRWILLAQIEMSSTADPVVIDTKQQRIVDSLPGHMGTVLGMSFSRDATKVVTACEDGKVRVFSAPGWKLLQTFTGHRGPVHWAEFSPDGKWLVSAGEDKTARVWSVATGELSQTLEESNAPLRTVAFSPNGEYFTASSEKAVTIWARTIAQR